MTDEQIIKALKCCEYTDELCYMCPEIKDGECIQRLHTMALDLISRQKAEIERLLQKLQQTKSEAIKEFAKFVIDKSENGIIRNMDIPDYVKEMTEVEE